MKWADRKFEHNLSFKVLRLSLQVFECVVSENSKNCNMCYNLQMVIRFSRNIFGIVIFVCSDWYWALTPFVTATQNCLSQIGMKKRLFRAGKGMMIRLQKNNNELECVTASIVYRDNIDQLSSTSVKSRVNTTTVFKVDKLKTRRSRRIQGNLADAYLLGIRLQKCWFNFLDLDEATFLATSTFWIRRV